MMIITENTDDHLAVTYDPPIPSVKRLDKYKRSLKNVCRVEWMRWELNTGIEQSIWITDTHSGAARTYSRDCNGESVHILTEEKIK